MIVRLATALGALALVGAAFGDDLVVSASIPYTDTNWSQSLVLNQFNVPGAHLDSIDIAFQGSIQSTVKLENRDQGAITYSASASYVINVTSPTSALLLSATPMLAPQTGNLSPYDGALDFGGTSGVTYSNIVGSSSGSAHLTSAADLAAFTGSGTVALPVDASATSAITGSGNMTKIVKTQAGASVVVTYHYTPYAPLGSLGDRVWFDVNGNGKQDDGEYGLANVPVKLLNGSNVVLKTTTTDDSGLYLFDDLPAGTYRVQFGKPAGYGYSFTNANVGTDEAIDSDADGSGLTGLVTLGAGQNRLDVDAGLVGCFCVGDRVWKDLDRDGLQDSCEPGVPGVPVHLLNADGDVIADTVTDSCGNYKFCNVAGGDYSIDFDVPTGYGFTKQYANSAYKAYDSNADQDTGLAPFTLVSNDMTIDAGLVGAQKIGDTVWLDSDGDGKFDVADGEKGLKGVHVYLMGDTNGDGWPDVYASTVTDANGHYLFSSLYPGTYAVYTNSNDLRGLAPTYDLDGTRSPNFAIGKLLTGSDNLDFDFGYKPVSVCGNGSHEWWRCNTPCWPSSCLTVGGKCHKKSTICAWMKVGECNDKSICLYQRLCAAKLNVGSGCNQSAVYTCGRTTCSVKDAIKLADAWMAKHPVGCGVSASSADWGSICEVYGVLVKHCGK